MNRRGEGDLATSTKNFNTFSHGLTAGRQDLDAQSEDPRNSGTIKTQR
jgi:hypothetical protein